MFLVIPPFLGFNKRAKNITTYAAAIIVEMFLIWLHYCKLYPYFQILCREKGCIDNVGLLVSHPPIPPPFVAAALCDEERFGTR